MEYNRTEQNRMDYKNGKIYVLRSHQTDKIYIGSTTTKLSKRLSKHKSDFKYWKNGKYIYVSSYELMKYGDVYIELLELCPCDSKMELHKREGELIREMECVNKRIAGRTDKEYRADNKDKIKEYNKEWYEANQDKKKEYYQENKDKIKDRQNIKYDCYCGGKYNYSHKSKHFKSQKHLNHIPLV
jgi:hypothetical protein